MANSSQQIDVDELAREKVQEIENLLDSELQPKPDNISGWFSILKQIITAADLHRTNDKNGKQESTKTKSETDDSIYADYADDNEQFNAIDLSEQFATNSVKWTIRVKAFKLIHRLIQILVTNGNKHHSFTSKSSILKYLSDLIRLSFVAATSPYDDLKLQGFEMFKFLIHKFASVEEKEFPGHSILEQYKTQVLSALKPAFDLDAPPYITAIASQVCCHWLCQNLEKDMTNLKRFYQLMMTTLDKLEHQSINQNSKLYTESELEQERLDILGSWAQLYITAKCNQDPNISKTNTNATSNYLNELVQSNIDSLINKWWDALKDYALLIIPAPRIKSVQHDNEHVYTREVALKLFASVWPRLTLASSIWLCSDRCIKNTHISNDNNGVETTLPSTGNTEYCDNKCKNQSINRIKYFKFICGIIMKELCKTQQEDAVELDSLTSSGLSEATSFAIRSLHILVKHDEIREALVKEQTIVRELYTTLYHILIKQIRGKSQDSIIIRNLLDNLFNIVITKFSDQPNYVKYSVAQIILQIINNLTKLDNAIIDSSNNVEITKLELAMKVYNLITIIKLNPLNSTSELDLQESLIKTLQTTISFRSDFSVGISFLEPIRDLYTIIPIEYSISFIDALFCTKMTMATNILEVILDKEPQEKDKTSLYLETYLKFLKQDILHSRPTNRSKLLTTFVETLLEICPRLHDEKNDESLELRQRNILDLILKNINELQTTYPDEYKDAIKIDTQKIYDSAIELQQRYITKLKEKRISESAKKLASANNNKQLNKSAPKIILKADFSNFYAKKS